MSVASTAREVNAELRFIVEEGLAQLQEWLDIRLERQELLLRRLSGHVEVPGGTGNIRRSWPGTPQYSSPALSPQPDSPKLAQETFPNEAALRDGHLRIVANVLMDSRDTGVSSTSLEEVPLPGSTPDDMRSAQPAQNVVKTNGAWRAVRTEGSEPPRSRTLLSIDEIDDIDPDERSVSKNDTFGSAAGPPLQEQDWQSKLMDVFDQLDLDRSGTIDLTEFTEAFEEVGMPEMRALDVFTSMDRTQNGYIDRIEWLHIIEEAGRGSEDELNAIIKFLDRLAKRQLKKGRIYENDRTRRPRCILRHDSMYRMCWDIWIMTLLFYISMTMPFQLGFGEHSALQTIDRIFDIFFCFDVCLNFRTSFLDRDESIIFSGRKIACKYLKSWFLLDFLSSVPFDLITAGLLPNLTPARLLKIGKIAKVMKLLRISKMLSVLTESELMEKVAEKSTSRAHQTFVRIFKLAFMMFLVAHWLACFGAAVDKTSLEVYFRAKNEDPTEFRQYLAAIYWAMCTLSTVGYGDITPETDQERFYAILAMVLGGSLYGYVIGSVTSIVTDMDLNARAYQEKMELYQSWLDRHDELPQILRRRIRKHFKKTLAAKSAVDDMTVITDLSNELRGDTAHFIVHECVRLHPMFANMKKSELAKLVEVLQKSHNSKNEFVVKMGDPGIAMYILVEGAARYDQGVRFQGLLLEPAARFSQVVKGQSFGDEILFGIEESYTYTIITITDCVFHTISEDGFNERYQNMPELQQQMFECFKTDRGLSDDLVPGDISADHIEKNHIKMPLARQPIRQIWQTPYRKRTHGPRGHASKLRS